MIATSLELGGWASGFNNFSFAPYSMAGDEDDDEDGDDDGDDGGETDYPIEVNPLLNWEPPPGALPGCFVAATTLTSFLNVVDSQDLVASVEKILWSMVAQSLNNSKPNVSKSLDNLSILKTEVASLKVLFALLRRNIEDDYTEYGTCTRAIKDLRARDQRAHRHFRYIQEMKDFLKGLYKAALHSKKTPTQTIDQGVDFLVENEPVESSEGLIQIFKCFLKRLQDKIDEANGIVDEVLRNLESFQQNFKEVPKVKSDDTFVTFLERNPGERDQLIRRMKDLDRACRVYQELITGT
ncbi:uncharacterized protein LOC6502109 [Drosophila ananassae]|uniref:uncharacterized protein LOC6502109 n=1 Tax=Drosophila ananassae TaxID=7217 RepID=UPI001CFFBC08|nr:uncharacterized protein LOC6502109 [Drosophila ananassae]